MVHDLDLLLHHRNPAREIVVFPNLPGQLVQLGVCDGLLLIVGRQHSHESQPPGDQGRDDALRHAATSHAAGDSFGLKSVSLRHR